MDIEKAREAQNQIQIDTHRKEGPVKLGIWTSHIWRTDPRHLGFVLARYKFCAKMLAGKMNVLEIGCGDAFGTMLLLQTVKSVHCIDFEPLVVEDAKTRFANEGIERCMFSVHDITEKPLDNKYDAAFSLDVLEHIPRELEERLMANICASLRSNGVLIMGTPNIEAGKYASPPSAAGHINLKNMQGLKGLMERYFDNVFMFGMNDEVLHTGFESMCHYLLAIGAGNKLK